MEIELDYPPSLNSLYNVGKYGQMYKTDEGKAYLEKVGFLIKNEFKDVRFDRDNRCEVEIRVWFPDNRVRDLDNLIKVLQDAIEASGVMENDCWQVLFRLSLEAMGIDRTNPRIILEMKESDMEIIEID